MILFLIIAHRLEILHSFARLQNPRFKVKASLKSLFVIPVIISTVALPYSDFEILRISTIISTLLAAALLNLIAKEEVQAINLRKYPQDQVDHHRHHRRFLLREIVLLVMVSSSSSRVSVGSMY